MTLRHHSTRHLRVHTRLAIGTFLPLGLSTVALALAWIAQPGNGPAHALLAGALMLGAIGSGLVLLRRNTAALVQPMEEAKAVTHALALGQYDRRARIERLDEVGEVLVALEQLGDYLAVVLPEDRPAAGRGTGTGHAPVSDTSLERIAEQLRDPEMEDVFAGQGPQAASPMTAPRPTAPALPDAASRLRLVPGQA